MKKYLPFIVWVVIMLNGMFIYFLTGEPLERNHDLAFAYGFSCLIASTAAFGIHGLMNIDI